MKSASPQDTRIRQPQSEANATREQGDGDQRFGKAEGERHPQSYSLYDEDRRDPEAKPKRRDPSPRSKE
jgi:uncharacterized protein YdaT